MDYRISEARKAKGLTQIQLAELMETTQQTIQRYESGVVDIRADKLARIAEILGVSVSYLLYMDDSFSNDGYVEVPLYGSIAAGEPIEMVSFDNRYPVPSKIRERYPNGFLLRVDGESMNRILPNGSYAYIDPSEVVDKPMMLYAEIGRAHV